MYVAKEPTRDDDGCLVFEDASAFRPNLTPAEVIKRGSFGGGYFRSIRWGDRRANSDLRFLWRSSTQ